VRVVEGFHLPYGGATGSLGATAGASFYWFEATARMRTVLYLRGIRNSKTLTIRKA